MTPRTILHLDAAARNQTIAKRMLENFDPEVTPTHDDWIITIIFYSALHLIDAFLNEHVEMVPESHRQRSQLVRTNAVLRRIERAYFSLKAASETARYQPVHSFPPYAVQEAFDQIDEIRRLVTSHLDDR